MQSDLLPSYSVRISKKARYLQLRLKPTGLEVIVPEKMRISQDIIHQFLFEKKRWIEKYSLTFAEEKLVANNHTLPTSIFLMGMNEIWQIIYREASLNRIRLKINTFQELIIEGAIFNQEICVIMLKRWLRQKSAHFLKTRLVELSHKVQLPFNAFAVRDMKSRWGSCSSEKKITLCINLIFLPIHLIDHVLLHELCHTKYMSHGKRFWSLLERFDAAARKHNHELKTATTFIPKWLYIIEKSGVS